MASPLNTAAPIRSSIAHNIHIPNNFLERCQSLALLPAAPCLITRAQSLHQFSNLKTSPSLIQSVVVFQSLLRQRMFHLRSIQVKSWALLVNQVQVRPQSVAPLSDFCQSRKASLRLLEKILATLKLRNFLQSAATQASSSRIQHHLLTHVFQSVNQSVSRCSWRGRQREMFWLVALKICLIK